MAAAVRNLGRVAVALAAQCEPELGEALALERRELLPRFALVERELVLHHLHRERLVPGDATHPVLAGTDDVDPLLLRSSGCGGGRAPGELLRDANRLHAELVDRPFLERFGHVRTVRPTPDVRRCTSAGNTPPPDDVRTIDSRPPPPPTPDSSTERLSIGEAARRSGKRASAIRYYEEIELLPAPERQNGRRSYGPEVVRTLAVIETARRAGLALDEVRVLLSVTPGDESAIERLREIAERKLPELAAQIERMELARGWLEAAALCRCPSLDECPLFDNPDRLPPVPSG
jgi:MerR family redox-sensitive transcriptional activator SoxR